MSQLKDIKAIFLDQVYNMNGTVTFDREHAEWLIEQAETLDKIARRWIEIEENGTPKEADDFYTFVQDTLIPEAD